MEQILYIPSFDKMLAEYADAADLMASYAQYGCTGLEIIRCNYGSENNEIPKGDGDRERNRRLTGAAEISPEMIRGVHMIFYPAWLDFWRGDEAALLKEFGSRETWEGFYMGRDRSALISQFTADLDYAKKVGAAYVVFHVSDVLIEEVFTHCHAHSDREVIDVNIEVINEILDGGDYEFDFLMENLWWPGLTMTDPVMTKRLLDGVHYKKKGIMLDLGHLMCANMELNSEEEAIEYIGHMLSEHDLLRTDTGDGEESGRSLTSYIKGVHMHQSITGAFAKKSLKEVREKGLTLAEDYYDRFSQVYELLGNVDTHRPFTSPEAKGLIERIAPKYAVHELMAKDRVERDAMLSRQSRLLR